MALISVVIPCYNRREYLPRAINSVLNQTFKDIDVWIIDDASNDKTSNIIDNFVIEAKKRSILIHYHYYSPNKGVSFARNQGIKLSSSPWIAFLDSDDEWLPEKLFKQINFINNQINHNNHLNIIHGNEIWQKNNKIINQQKKHQKSGGDIFIRSLKLCLISPSCVLIKRSLIEEIGSFDENFPVCEDYDMWLRITAKYKASFINEPLIIKHGGHKDQLSTKYFAMDYFRIKSILKVLNNYYLTPEKKYKCWQEIFSKSNILLKGYKKHKNYHNYQEIFNYQKLALESTRHFFYI